MYEKREILSLLNLYKMGFSETYCRELEDALQSPWWRDMNLGHYALFKPGNLIHAYFEGLTVS